MSFIGLDLGATKLAAALFSEQGEVIQRTYQRLEGKQGEAVGRLMVEQVLQLSSQGEPVRGVAASVPSIANQREGTVWAPNIPGWENFLLRATLQASVPPGVAVAIDSDRACSILGESARGAARGCDHAIFLAVGTGIGAGILIDGRILRGANDIAGAIGWMALDRPYRVEYDATGCFETHASGAGIEKTARRLLSEHPGHNGPLARCDAARLTAQDVFAAYDQGDALAREALDTAIACWSQAVANLVSLFNPQVIVLGGGVFGPAARFLDRIVAEARQWSQPVSMGLVAIRSSVLGADACLYGTGQLARAAWESQCNASAP